MGMVLLTRFEVAKLIGMRALQIYDGSDVKVVVDDPELRDNSLYIAALELQKGLIDARIVRDDETIDVKSARLPDSLEMVIANFAVH